MLRPRIPLSWLRGSVIVFVCLLVNLCGCGSFLVSQPDAATQLLIAPQDVRAATPRWRRWPGEEVPPAAPTVEEVKE